MSKRSLEDTLTPEQRVDSDDLLRYLKHRYGADAFGNGGYAVFPEFRCGTGFGKHAESRIDCLVMGLWPSKGLLRIAYEIKVSRSDFKRDLKRFDKQYPALRVSNLFYYLTPPGLVKPEELPIWAGLVEARPSVESDAPERIVDADRWIKQYKPFQEKVTVKAPHRNIEFEQEMFVAALARRVAEVEGRDR